MIVNSFSGRICPELFTIMSRARARGGHEAYVTGGAGGAGAAAGVAGAAAGVAGAAAETADRKSTRLNSSHI